jgi:hypothetical protein
MTWPGNAPRKVFDLRKLRILTCFSSSSGDIATSRSHQVLKKHSPGGQRRRASPLVASAGAEFDPNRT